MVRESKREKEGRGELGVLLQEERRDAKIGGKRCGLAVGGVRSIISFSEGPSVVSGEL